MGQEVEATAEGSLVRRSAHGDGRAFAVLVNRYRGMVYSTALRLLNDTGRAEDAAQDTFIKAYAALPGFRGEAKFSSWLYRICYNCCISMLRKKRPEIELKEAAAVSVPGPVEEVRSRSIKSAMMDEVAQMPADYRAMITLYHFNGLSYEEIALTTHKPLGTVKAQIHRARALLKTRLIERVGWEELRKVIWT
jgi:RNA polymerase sigma-70 factor (ECF subfamily)